MKTPPNQLNRLARREVNEPTEDEILPVAQQLVVANAQQIDEEVAL